MWGFKDITAVRFSNADAQIETLVYPHFCSRYPWESIWACIGLSLLIFFCVYICLCKKAYHLLLDQPLPMAPPLLLSLLLLPPLPPSLRPSTQVSARFSSAKTYPPPHTIFQHRRCSLFSAAPHHLTAATKAWSHLPNDGRFGCATNSLALSPLLSLPDFQISDVWIDTQQW